MANAEALAQKIAGQGEGFDIKFNDLENLQDLSSGNFGKVYRGTYLGTPVAVKKLLDVDDEFMHKYIEREMGILRYVALDACGCGLKSGSPHVKHTAPPQHRSVHGPVQALVRPVHCYRVRAWR